MTFNVQLISVLILKKVIHYPSIDSSNWGDILYPIAQRKSLEHSHQAENFVE